jgi:drug/metabolite transporter (DMT)-like permease
MDDRSVALPHEGHHLRGVLFVVGAALFWSFGGLWIKLIDMNGLAVAGGRSAIAAALVWIYLRGSRVSVTRELLLGAVAYAGTVIFFVLATKNTTAANAILIQYTAPVYVALLSSRMLRERITALDWGTIALVLGGMVLLMLDGLESGGLFGNLLALASGIFFALCVIAIRMGRAGSAIGMVLYGNVLTALIGLPFAFATPPDGSDLLYLSLLGVVQLGLGYIFFVEGMKWVSAIEGALLPVIEPVLNPVWVVVFAGEEPSVNTILGGLLIVGAVTLRSLARARQASLP